jgi:hypothetical protein
MPEASPVPLRHLNFSNRANRQDYTARPAGGGSDFSVFPQQRAAHAKKLQQELQVVEVEAERLRLSAELAPYVEDVGINIVVRSEPGYELRTDVLDAPRFGVTLKNVRTLQVQQPDGKMLEITEATVFVKHGKLSYLTQRVADYADTTKKSETGKELNREFVANTAAIGLAAIEAFWTSLHPLPDLDVLTWWEVWVRTGGSEAKREVIHAAVHNEAQIQGFVLRGERLKLPEHTVYLLRATRRKLAAAVGLLNFVSELRHPAITAAFFVEQRPSEQRKWVEDLLNRTTPPPENAPAICILDTGVNRGHPLIEGLLAEQDLETLRADWGKDDHEGHGTGMAGLAVYGDLTPLLGNDGKVQLTHRLESVKVLPRTGHNEPEHYGALTQEAMARAELNAPERQRVFALAITATDAKDYHENGKPSAWSAALDGYAAGYLEEDETRRLICVSAGNVRLSKGSDYPSLNDLSSIEDPAQSWNAVTVGAFTEKDVVTDADGNLLEGNNPTAKKGGLCPASTTSTLWIAEGSRHWPIKPEIVMEGGNCATDHTDFPTWFDSLSLLTTNAEMQRGLLTTFQATSAATALAARLAAIVQSQYPQYWPETIRALMIHASDWTDEMKRGRKLSNKSHVAEILHRFGYGVPSLEKCLNCARSRATLICQDNLQPFEKEKGESLKTKDMMLYKLPWPKALLTEHPDTLMRMRVTLSYFIEPNPGSRAVNNKYRYASCNLRFKVQTPTESLKTFIARVSDTVSDEDRETYAKPDDTTEGWLIGEELSCRGSLHCDTWQGTAAQLAQMEHLLVYPANGWWRLRPYLEQFNRRIRYSLVVSIESCGLDIDLYTPIATTIAQIVPAGEIEI